MFTLCYNYTQICILLMCFMVSIVQETFKRFVCIDYNGFCSWAVYIYIFVELIAGLLKLYRLSTGILK